PWNNVASSFSFIVCPATGPMICRFYWRRALKCARFSANADCCARAASGQAAAPPSRSPVASCLRSFDHLVGADEHPTFAERDVMEYRIGSPHQSALRLAAWITLPHFSVSSAINFPNAADVIDIGSTPKPASRAFMRGSAATALISVLSLSITSAGVSFGAPTPYHWLTS